MAAHDPMMRGHLAAIEVSITRIHLDASIMMQGEDNRVDPDKWHPLIMSFQQFYGLAPGKLHRSELAEIPESLYRPAARV
jgi:hypothetical protein